MPKRIEYLRLERRAYNALLKNKIDFIDNVAKMSSLSLAGLQGIGIKGVEEIKAKMQEHGYETKPLNSKHGWGFSKLGSKNEKNRTGGGGAGMCS